MPFWKKTRIYLDHAATTPIDGEVLRVMNQVFENNYFNPGGLYKEGVATAKLVSESRKTVAKLLGTTSDHIIFTRGGTESNNMAILGTLAGHQTPHVVTSVIEHSAVLETLKYLESKKQIELSIIPVDEYGIVIVDEIKKALRPETVLVSIMYVNNEIGTIQPIKEIAKLIRWYKKHHAPGSHYPLFHTDAIQATNYLEIGVEQLGVDLMSLSGSKIYGPKSSGVLYVRNKELVSTMFHGGNQEFGLRAGTEDVAQIVGFTKALELARKNSESEIKRLKELQEYFFSELEKNIPGMRINGAKPSLLERQGETLVQSSPREAGGSVRICNNINISIPGIPSERLIIELDAKGICAASKSACREDADEESYVIAALHTSGDTTDGSIRFTMGKTTTKTDIEKTVSILKGIIEKIKKFEAELLKK
jgi:cysteine desulfurase